MRNILATITLLTLSSSAIAQQAGGDPGSFKDMAPYLAKCPGVTEDTDAESAISKPDLTGMDQNQQIVVTCDYLRKRRVYDIKVGDEIRACATGDFPILGSISAIYDGGYLHGFQAQQQAKLCHFQP